MKPNYHQRIAKNEQGRDFVVGDIHAHKKKFLRALESVNFDKSKDRLFAVGDIVDRGHQPLFILDCLREPWFYSVLGNHEQFILNRYDLPLIASEHSKHNKGPKTRYEVVELHEKHNGGKWFGKLRDSAKRNIYLALKKLPYLITLETAKGNIGLVHAEVPGTFESWDELVTEFSEDVREQAIWGLEVIKERYDFNSLQYVTSHKEPRIIQGISLTVHGHVMTHEPVVYGNQIWIDTGRLTGELTIIEVQKLFEIVSDK